MDAQVFFTECRDILDAHVFISLLQAFERI